MLWILTVLCLLSIASTSLAQPFSDQSDATKNSENMVRTERGWAVVYHDQQRIYFAFKPYAADASEQPWQESEIPPDPNPSPSLEACIGAKEIYEGATNLRTMVFVPWILSEEWNDRIHVRIFRITGALGAPPYTVEMLPDWILPLPAGFNEGADTWLTQPTISTGSVPTVFVGVNSTANPSSGGVCCWYSHQWGPPECTNPDQPCVFEGQTVWESHWLDDGPEVDQASHGTIGNVSASTGYEVKPCVAWTKRGWDGRMSEVWYTDCWDYSLFQFRWLGIVHEHDDPWSAPLEPIFWSGVLGNRGENDFHNLSLTGIQNTLSWIAFEATATATFPRKEACVLRGDHSLHAHMPYQMPMWSEDEWNFISYADCDGDVYSPSLAIEGDGVGNVAFHRVCPQQNAQVMFKRWNGWGQGWPIASQYMGSGQFATLSSGSPPPHCWTGKTLLFTGAGTPYRIVLKGTQRRNPLYVDCEPAVPISSFETLEPPLHFASSVVVQDGGTLVIRRRIADCASTPNAEMTFEQNAQIIVEDGGTLTVEGESGDPIIFKASGIDKWAGFLVRGSASFSHCTIQDATTGIESNKAEQISVTNCTLEKNGVGFYAYQPSGSTAPNLTNCIIADNDNEGVSLLECFNGNIAGCSVSDNGSHGIMLTNSYAKIANVTVQGNGVGSKGGYGLYLFGSSPTVHCSHFVNDHDGEMSLLDHSYPVLWSAPGTSAGLNEFRNDRATLFVMSKSDPVVKKGHNNFLLGGTGYFMADGTPGMYRHDLSDNYYSPSLQLSYLSPPNPLVWTWTSTDPTPSSCAGASGQNPEGAEATFSQGFEAEMSGDYTAAESAYEQTIANYSSDALSYAAATRLFDVQRQLGSGFADRQTYMNDVADTAPDSSALGPTADALATRLFPEEDQYQPPLNTYSDIMSNPPSLTDSVFAAVDFAVTTIRLAYESDDGNLDSEGPTPSPSSVSDAMQVITSIVTRTTSPSHQGYTLVPNRPKLLANFPNPFNPTTSISYYMPFAGHARVEVFDVQGRRVAELLDEERPAGEQRISWDARQLSAGVYFCRMDAVGSVSTLKLLLLK